MITLLASTKPSDLRASMKKKSILIIDDNESVLTSLELLLEKEFSDVRTASNPNQINSLLTHNNVDLLILDMNFSTGVNNGNEGLYWLSCVKEINPNLPVIMLTAYGDVELAVQALKRGATDFLLKPWNNTALIEKITEALSQYKKGSKERKVTDSPNLSQMIVGDSPAMTELMKVVTKVAKTNANTLITGENGTGKEMLAKEIHRLSTRSNHGLFTVDMGAVTDSLFESELFGHTKGSFTNAYENRAGKFEAADKGTLFLDEIGNLPIASQSKLLSALQNRRISRIGSNEEIEIDVRLISATNKNLDDMVAEGTFREDLLYRINTIHIEIPPLRERGDDILLFIDAFLNQFAQQYDRSSLTIEDKAIKKLRAHHWSGNIRELQHTIEKLVILSEGDMIRAEDIDFETRTTGSNLPIGTSLEEMERITIKNTIKKNKGNLSATAEQLGISRQTLYNKLKQFNL